MKKLGLIFVFTLAVSPLVAQNADSQDDYYTGYEGVVLGERAPRSATDAIAQQATQIPGDIYRGTLFGAEQKKYEGDTLGNRPRAKTKYVYDTSLVRAAKISDVIPTHMATRVNISISPASIFEVITANSDPSHKHHSFFVKFFIGLLIIFLSPSLIIFDVSIKVLRIQYWN